MIKRRFDEIHREYKKYKSEEKDIKQLYNNVKKEYINNKKLDFTLEKIYLQKELEKYQGETIQKYNNLIWIFAGIIFTIIIEKGFENNDNILLMTIILFLGLTIPTIIGIYIERNTMKKEIYKHIYYNVCLEVIKDIENKNKALG